jgi:hypothetical protein
VQEAAFAILGVIVGVAITSGYSFWAIRRAELAGGLAAAKTLDDEMQRLHAELSRRSGFDAQPVVDVWRDQRQALVLFVDSESFRFFGDAVWAAERCAMLGNRSAGDLPQREVDSASAERKVALARELLNETAASLRAEHDTPIVTSVWRALLRKEFKLDFADRLAQPR